jgi:hypothetical protein
MGARFLSKVLTFGLLLAASSPLISPPRRGSSGQPLAAITTHIALSACQRKIEGFQYTIVSRDQRRQQIAHQPHHQHLAFRVAKAGIEFEQLPGRQGHRCDRGRRRAQRQVPSRRGHDRWRRSAASNIHAVLQLIIFLRSLGRAHSPYPRIRLLVE